MFEEDKTAPLFELEWDVPVPVKIPQLRNHKNKWSTRLADFKHYPGRKARVLNGYESDRYAHSRRRTIIDALYKADPYDHWEVKVHRNDDRTYGVWVSWEGRFSEREYLAREAGLAHRSIERRKLLARKKVERQMKMLDSPIRPRKKTTRRRTR